MKFRLELKYLPWNGWQVGPYSFCLTNIPKNLHRVGNVCVAILLPFLVPETVVAVPTWAGPENVPVKFVNSINQQAVVGVYRYSSSAFSVSGEMPNSIRLLFANQNCTQAASIVELSDVDSLVPYHDASYFCSPWPTAAATLYYPKYLNQDFSIYPEVVSCFEQLTAAGCNITKSMGQSLAVAEEKYTGTAITVVSSAAIGALLMYGLFRCRTQNPAAGGALQAAPPPPQVPAQVEESVRAKQPSEMVCD